MANLRTTPEPLRELYASLVHGRGVSEPRQVVKLLSAVPAPLRHEPICHFADAVIARTGNLEAANGAHRATVQAMHDDPDALCAVLCSWFDVALNLGNLEVVLELRERCAALVDELEAARVIIHAIDAAGLWAVGMYAEAETALVEIVNGLLPGALRGPIAFLRAMSLQALGLFDASVAVLDADAHALGSFDLAGEMLRARAVWIAGEHLRARSMLAAVHEEARLRKRQHDGDYAAAMARVFAQLDGEPPELREPTGSTPRVAAIVYVSRALAMLPDELQAEAYLLAHPEVLSCAPEFLAVPYVLCSTTRERIDAQFADNEPSGSLLCARHLVARRAGKSTPAMDAWDMRNFYRPWRDELHAAAATPVLMRSERSLIRVIGPVSIERDGVIASVRRERVRSLLVALALHRRTTRERLSDLLWPDLAPKNGANNLRTTLTYARQLFTDSDDSCIRVDGSVVSLDADVDLWAMDEAAVDARASAARGDSVSAHAAWLQSCAAFEGRFAQDVGDSAWVDAARASIEASQIEALLQGAESSLVGARDTAGLLAERALSIDPWSERAFAVLVQASVADGDVAAARRAVQRAELALEELGVSMGGTLGGLAAQVLLLR